MNIHYQKTMYAAKYLLSIQIVVVMTAAMMANAFAHDGETPTHYVAISGEDKGSCDQVEHPCRTLDYVLTQAEKGDTVLVAAGSYAFRQEDPAEMVTLLSPIVQVKGGYSIKDGFKSQNKTKNKTVINGVLPDYAPKLATRGFISLAQANPEGVAANQASPLANIGTPRYVTEDGRGDSDCVESENPCSLTRALELAKSGDSVLIAQGSYNIPPELAEELMRPDITVVGGVSEQTGFARQAGDQTDFSYITGPNFDQRENLQQRGLTLIQDRKGLSIKESRQRAAVSPFFTESLAATACDSVSGMAGPFPCRNIDLLAHMPLSSFSSTPQAANDIWGFVDRKDGNEYAIIGLFNGTAIVNVSDPENPIEVGTIGGRDAQWRDIKVYQFKDDAGRWQAYAYVTADNPIGGSQGLQIIDLSGLPTSVSLAATWNEIRRAHNVYISNVDYSDGTSLSGMQPFVYIAGADTHLGAARALDISTPTAPIDVLVPDPGTQYIHDGTSFVLTDSRTAACKSGTNPPASGHNPCEIFIDFNENTLDIWDVTDKQQPLMVSSTPYPNAHYTHSGWWSSDKNFIFLQDELDEQNAGLNTTLRTVDISDLSAPALTNVWSGPTRSIDHNGFTKGDRYYMSNYRRGLTVLDVSDPNTPVEQGFFDTFPSPAANTAQFNGAWGVYPFLPSGTLVVSDIEGGLFVLRETNDDQPGGEPDQLSYEYAVKLVCGIQKEPENGQLVRGRYGTIINIGNIGDKKANFTKRLALSIPPGAQRPGESKTYGKDTLTPMQALKTDCRDIAEKVFGGSFPTEFIEGFVIVRSNERLEVSAVYSANNLNDAQEQGSGTVDTDYVHPRLISTKK